MWVNQINLNHLRVFECVFRTRSMTEAARILGLTQSGVSQHIRSFEEMLGVRLFDRIQQKIVPTFPATLLFEECSRSFSGLEEVLASIQGDDKSRELSGNVSIGMPIEFGNNVILPLLSEFGKKHPRVQFSIRLGLASAMSERLLSGDLDFALVDSVGIDQRVALEKVYDEVLDLCVSETILGKFGKTIHSKRYYEALDYVEYQKGAPILGLWFNHHLGIRNPRLKVRATVMDVQGVARLIISELGAGILPHHLALKLRKDGWKLRSFKGCGRPLKNAISMAYLRDRTHSKAASAFMSWLRVKLGPVGRLG